MAGCIMIATSGAAAGVVQGSLPGAFDSAVQVYSRLCLASGVDPVPAQKASAGVGGRARWWLAVCVTRSPALTQ